MKKTYEEPSVQIIVVEEDIITTSILGVFKSKGSDTTVQYPDSWK